MGSHNCDWCAQFRESDHPYTDDYKQWFADVTTPYEEIDMAHTLNFTTNGWDEYANVQEKDKQQQFRVVYRDNLHIILSNNGGEVRRVYQVREWCRVNQCRATRME